MSATSEPVTLSGCYAHLDGTVGRYAWANGRVVLVETYPSWAEVESDEDRWRREARAERAALASRGEP